MSAPSGQGTVKAYVHEGDAASVLRTFPEGCIRCCVTSPPYWGLRVYGGDDAEIGMEGSPQEWCSRLVEVFREVRRVLTPDGTLWVVVGDAYAGSGKNSGNTKDLSAKQATNAASANLKTPAIPGVKPKDLIGLPWMLAFALREDGWYLRADVIWQKCVSGGTVVYAKTQKGEAPMTVKDLVRLDPSTVSLWDGEKWNPCVRWTETPRPEGPIEIALRNGQRLGCTADHRWPTERGLLQAGEIRAGDVLRGTTLPEPAQPASPEHVPDDIGWFVGLYIAEGSRGKNGKVIRIASHAEEEERFARLKMIAGRYGGTCRVHKTSPQGATCDLYSPVLRGIIEQYVSGEGASGKHLDARCWSRSNAFLRAVLDGYLDGDGHRRESGEWRLGFCADDQLTADLRTICARLGLSLRLKRVKHVMDGRRFSGWRGSIREPEKRRTRDFEVMSVGASRARKFWDIELAEAPHVFALASGVLTHNSNPMPENVRDRPTRSHEHVFLLSRSRTYFYDADAVAEPSVQTKSGNKKWKYGADVGRPNAAAYGRSIPWEGTTRNKRDVWTVAPDRKHGVRHTATFPLELASLCIKAGSREGDWVLDPFAGSGTTVEAACRLSRNGVGIDLNPEYVEGARERCREWADPAGRAHLVPGLPGR